MRNFSDDAVWIITTNAQKLSDLEKGFCLYDSDRADHNGITVLTEIKTNEVGLKSIHCSCLPLTSDIEHKYERLGYLTQPLFDSLSSHEDDGCRLKLELHIKKMTA
jgi:hypothetical protein